jgi:hypothetical protein
MRTADVTMVRIYLTEGQHQLDPLLAKLHDEEKVRGVTVFRGIWHLWFWQIGPNAFLKSVRFIDGFAVGGRILRRAQKSCQYHGASG